MKSMKLLPTVAVPMAGVLSMPVSWTESPSGSMPSSGTGIRTVPAATTRAVRFFGCGREFSRAFQRQDVDGDGGGALLALRVHGVVDGPDRLGLGCRR